MKTETESSMKPRIKDNGPSSNEGPPRGDVPTSSGGLFPGGTPLARNEQWQPRAVLELPEAEPWPEAVGGNVLLDELARVMKRFVVLPHWGAEALALWTVHTYAFQLRDITTYIGVESPEKRCGKTTLLTLLGELVNRPVVASNISSPAFFRVIEETRPTL